MDLIEVDDVDSQAAQAGIESLADVCGASAFHPVAEAHSKLGRDDRVVAAALECFTEEFFALSGTVDIGGIEKVDARIESGVDDGLSSRSVRAPAKVIATDANKRDAQRADFSVFH
jgi:hypothetical protein